VPAMRKDFLVDSYQLLEARAAGAGGVLVVLRMLPREQIETLIDHALRLGLFVLLEAFDEQDIAFAHELIGARADRQPAADRVQPVNRRAEQASNRTIRTLSADVSKQPLLLVGVNCRDL